MRRPTRLMSVLTAVSVLAAATACATRAPSDSIILYYKSGAGDDKQFQECIAPGQSGSWPVDDEVYELPTSLRTWNLRRTGGDSDQPIHSGTRPKAPAAGQPAQPGPEVAFWVTADFYLNTDCGRGDKDPQSPVVQFWENTGRRYQVSTDSEDGFNEANWKTVLHNTLAPAQEKALREVARGYDADDLDANTNGVWATIERQMAPAFQRELRAKVGGDYFCGTGYARGAEVTWTELVADGTDDKGLPKVKEEQRKGKCPPVRVSVTDVTFADPGIAAARARVFEAEQNAKAKFIEAQSQVAVANTLAQAGKDPAYVRLRELEVALEIANRNLEAAKVCASNPKCTVVVGTGAPGVSVNSN